MVSRIKQRFDDLAARNRSGLVTFLTAGDPNPQASLSFMHALVRGGADVIELGVPFSDPMADGPIIQRASERALAGGMTLRGVLDLVSRFRATDPATPIVLMGYLNPFERMGYGTFSERAQAAGADGVLAVDLPPEEAEAFHRSIRECGLDQIFLLAPNSSSVRINSICEYASGFVYYVSVKGVTGDKVLDAADVRAKTAALRAATALPVGVGFGVKNPAAAAAIADVCDAVIVGSALVEIVERAGASAAQAALDLARFVADLRAAMDATRRAA